MTVVSFKGLLVDLCRDVHADCVVKGIRAVSDFDYEMKQAHMNARMGVETVFLPTGPEYSYLSSSLMKEVVTLGGDIAGLVPPCGRGAAEGEVRPMSTYMEALEPSSRWSPRLEASRCRPPP